MAKATVTAKGQVTIPKAVRERMGLRVGDKVDFVVDRGEYRLRKHVGPNPLKPYRGYLKELAGRDPDQIVREMRDP